MPDHPNIFVIVSDTFRPDHIGINGAGFAETPELDDFLRRGVTFDNALVSSFPTIPMRTDWWTGRFGHPRYGWQDLEPSTQTLPDILRRNGYTTQLIADTTHMLRSKFWEHVRHFSFRRGRESDAPFCRLNEPPARVVSDRRKVRVDPGVGEGPVCAEIQPHTNFTAHYEDQAHSSLLAGDVCRWIEGNWKANPWFLWVDFFDVHEPWFPPEYLWRHYQPKYNGEPMVQPNYSTAEVYSPEELANMRARYAATCTLTSKNIGRCLRVAADAGLFENTIFVFLSDHGMFLGEHNLTGKSLITPDKFDVFPFHREVARHCFTIAAPGIEGNQRSGVFAQAPDLLPTLLDLAGIEAPKQPVIEGVSLVPAMRGDDSPVRSTAITAWSIRLLGNNFVHSRHPAITDGEWTLMLFEPPEPQPPQLYHTKTDPGHERNVFDQHRAEAERLYADFIAFMKAHDANAATLERHKPECVGLG